MKSWDKQKIADRTRYLLNRVGLELERYLDCYPKELSGGEQQRVGIVRAIIHESEYLLMDEPFSALDPISREQLQVLTKELYDEFKMTTIFVTHDVREALKLADRIAVLNQGQLVQMASPTEIVTDPSDAFVAELFGGVHHD